MIRSYIALNYVYDCQSVGTRPSPRSLLALWECFHNNRHVGGACGEIYVMTGKGKKLFNPLVAAQNFVSFQAFQIGIICS